MAHRAHHSTNQSPRHNTTRSGSTKDTRPKAAAKQHNQVLDPTGGSNPVSKLNSNSERGQTLGNGPWGQGHGLPSGVNASPFDSYGK